MRVLAAALLVFPPAWGAEITTGGQLDSDLRLSLPGKDAPPGAESIRFLRLDNTARAKLHVAEGDVTGRFDVALVWRGLHGDLSLDDVRTRERSDPVEIESDALYLTFSDLVVEGVELRVGRQIVQWGAADRFNPTSVLNPLDLEDPIEFGARVPNEMLLLSYTAPWTVDGEDLTLFDELTFTAAFVPVHRPGQFPASAKVVFTDPDLFVQFVDSPLLTSFLDLQKAFVVKGGQFDYLTEIETPSRSLDHAQYAGRVSFTAVGIDLSATFFDGYSDSLQAAEVDADLSSDLSVLVGDASVCSPGQTPDCGAVVNGIIEQNPDDPFGALQGLLDSASELNGVIPTRVRLKHPEVQVVGFDATTSLDFIDGVGVWVEAAMTKHEAQVLTLRAGGQTFEETLVEAGSFWKVAGGLDYTIASWWYVNAQFLHGFVDEFGADNLDDYVVAGTDFKMFTDQLTLRLFGIYQLQDASYIAYPALMGRFWQGAEVILGVLYMGGEDDSKFGSPATGQSRAFLEGRYSF